MKNVVLTLVVIVLLSSNYVSADESITWTPIADKTQIGRFEWFESAGKLTTVGFADTYKDGSNFGKARVFNSVNKSFSAGTEVRFSSWGDAQIYCGPQVSIKIGTGFTSVRYWMKDGSNPDWGSYTYLPLNKKRSLWFDATWNLNSSGKTLLFEPQIGYEVNKNWGITLQHRCGSIWPQSETVMGVRLKF